MFGPAPYTPYSAYQFMYRVLRITFLEVMTRVTYEKY